MHVRKIWYKDIHIWISYFKSHKPHRIHSRKFFSRRTISRNGMVRVKELRERQPPALNFATSWKGVWSKSLSETWCQKVAFYRSITSSRHLSRHRLVDSLVWYSSTDVYVDRTWKKSGFLEKSKLPNADSFFTTAHHGKGHPNHKQKKNSNTHKNNDDNNKIIVDNDISSYLGEKLFFFKKKNIYNIYITKAM